jgi:excisionase family DNA binding protein
MATLLASTKHRQMLAATPAELHQAQGVVDLLGARANRKLALTAPQHEDLVAVPEELTTSTAAEQLGIPRTTLMKMIVRSEIPAHKAGSHTRPRTCDVMAFRSERQARPGLQPAGPRPISDSKVPSFGPC